MIKILKFESKTCGPCKVMQNILDKMEVVVEKIDIDDHPDMVESYGIRNVPTLIFMKADKEAKRLVGMQSQEKIKNTLDII